MSLRSDAQEWIIEALHFYGGSATIIQICKYVWAQHETELRSSEDGFYTWQYDVRWAAQALRDKGILKPISETERGLWKLQ